LTRKSEPAGAGTAQGFLPVTVMIGEWALITGLGVRSAERAIGAVGDMSCTPAAGPFLLIMALGWG
jgi:hypothetical protein